MMKMNVNPLVSVIIPAYNMAKYTVRTVASLVKQTYSYIEIIVVDDGSSDDTGKELEKYGDRITYIYQENMGGCAARNRGFHASKGDLVAFLDCDDLYHEDKLERFVAHFCAFPHVGMVYSPEYLVDAEDRIIGINISSKPYSGYVFLPLLRNNFIGSSTPIIRREVIEKVGMWDEEIFTTADWDMWLRISREYMVGYIDQTLSLSRQESRYNQNNLDRTQREAYYVLEKFKMDGIPDRLLRVSRSNIELLLHRYSFDNGDYRNSLAHLLRAIQNQPIQLKSYCLLIMACLWRPLYRVLLKRKSNMRMEKWRGKAQMGGSTR